MNSAARPSRTLPRALLAATAAMLALIFYFGLRFTGGAITNDVAWIQDAPGIRFGRSGIVYADPVALSPAAPLSIEMALQSNAAGDGHFQFVLLLHGGEDARQLVIGQWRSWLIVMNGDDYDARRRQPRIAVNALQADKTRFVTVTSGEGGTAVYLDGRLAKRRPDLQLQLPDARNNGRLVLGNSIHGRHAWTGALYGLARYERVLSAEAVERHFQRWRREGSFTFAASENPAGLYLFDEKRGTAVVDHSGEGNPLRIPHRMTILTKTFLSMPFADTGNRPSLLQDMLINIVGFVPMGFLLSALLVHRRSRPLLVRIGWVMLACGGISLAIELTQAWIPGRSSQMLDLILNTLGGGGGVLLHSIWHRTLWPGRSPRA